MVVRYVSGCPWGCVRIEAPPSSHNHGVVLRDDGNQTGI